MYAKLCLSNEVEPQFVKVNLAKNSYLFKLKINCNHSLLTLSNTEKRKRVYIFNFDENYNKTTKIIIKTYVNKIRDKQMLD